MEELHRLRKDTPFGWLAALLAALRARSRRAPERVKSAPTMWVHPTAPSRA